MYGEKKGKIGLVVRALELATSHGVHENIDRHRGIQLVCKNHLQIL